MISLQVYFLYQIRHIISFASKAPRSEIRLLVFIFNSPYKKSHLHMNGKESDDIVPLNHRIN